MKTATISNLSTENKLLKVSHNNFNTPVHRLLEYAELLPFKKGHILFNIGNIARGMYIVNKGKVKLSKFGVDGKEQIIKILSPGDITGHEALLNDQRFHEYAEVLEDAELYYIGMQDFETAYTNHLPLFNYITHLICEDLNMVEERLVSSAYEPVRGRLASIILELSAIYENDGSSAISLSRGDLANMAGTAKETTIRLLYEFKNEDLIEINGQDIRVTDMEGLKRVACLYK